MHFVQQKIKQISRHVLKMGEEVPEKFPVYYSWQMKIIYSNYYYQLHIYVHFIAISLIDCSFLSNIYYLFCGYRTTQRGLSIYYFIFLNTKIHTAFTSLGTILAPQFCFFPIRF